MYFNFIELNIINDAKYKEIYHYILIVTMKLLKEQNHTQQNLANE